MKKTINCFLLIISLLLIYSNNSLAAVIYYDKIEVSLSSDVILKIAGDDTNSLQDEIERKIKEINPDVRKVEITRSRDRIFLKISVLSGRDVLSPELEMRKSDLYKISMDYARIEIVNKMKKTDTKIKHIQSKYENDILKLTISYKLPRPRKDTIVRVYEPIQKKEPAPMREPEPKTIKEKLRSGISLEIKSKDVISYKIDFEPDLKDKIGVKKPAPEPKPIVVKPKPAAPKPKAVAPKPKAVAVKPKPAAPKPKAVAPEPKPAAVKPDIMMLVHKIDDQKKVPKVDGVEEDDSLWENISPKYIKLKREDGRNARVSLKAAYFSDTIFILARWFDRTENRTHETLTWDKGKEEYVTGEDIEDSLAFLFYLEDVNDSCMTSGSESEADYWHWRAARSENAGYAFDGMIEVSTRKLAHANNYPGDQGKKVWIKRTPDSGALPWKIQLPIKFIGDELPSYLPNKPTVSAADVKARGSFGKNRWVVEFSRDMDTKHSDDIVFDVPKRVLFSIAVYDGDISPEHYASELIELRFLQK